MTCEDCGATYDRSDDSCAVRFDALLALDHSWQEPWGSRHGLAFAVFALQHPLRYDAATRARSWELLVRRYERGEPLVAIIRDVRSRGSDAHVETPPLPPATASFTVTIADLGDFAADDYPDALDRWCRATLKELHERE